MAQFNGIRELGTLVAIYALTSAAVLFGARPDGGWRVRARGWVRGLTLVVLVLFVTAAVLAWRGAAAGAGAGAGAGASRIGIRSQSAW